MHIHILYICIYTYILQASCSRGGNLFSAIPTLPTARLGIHGDDLGGTEPCQPDSSVRWDMIKNQLQVHFERPWPNTAESVRYYSKETAFDRNHVRHQGSMCQSIGPKRLRLYPVASFATSAANRTRLRRLAAKGSCFCDVKGYYNNLVRLLVKLVVQRLFRAFPQDPGRGLLAAC